MILSGPRNPTLLWWVVRGRRGAVFICHTFQTIFSPKRIPYAAHTPKELFSSPPRTFSPVHCTLLFCFKSQLLGSLPQDPAPKMCPLPTRHTALSLSTHLPTAPQSQLSCPLPHSPPLWDRGLGQGGGQPESQQRCRGVPTDECAGASQYTCFGPWQWFGHILQPHFALRMVFPQRCAGLGPQAGSRLASFSGTQRHCLPR